MLSVVSDCIVQLMLQLLTLSALDSMCVDPRHLPQECRQLRLWRHQHSHRLWVSWDRDAGRVVEWLVNWRCRGLGGVICVIIGNLQQPPAKLCLCTICLQCFDAVGWTTGTTSGLYKAVCWFVGGDILTGALHVLQLQLSPPPSPLAPVKSRMETFWYQLT